MDDVITTEDLDATLPADGGPKPTFPDVAQDVVGPIWVGGPLACGKCTCDGTLYACLQGSCGGPPPPPPPNDASMDATADASDAATCGNAVACVQIPVECLPKPTCECISKATGNGCVVAPNGSGFQLFCP